MLIKINEKRNKTKNKLLQLGCWKIINSVNAVRSKNVIFSHISIIHGMYPMDTAVIMMISLKSLKRQSEKQRSLIWSNLKVENNHS